MTDTEKCEHELACRKCGTGIGELHRTAEPDPEFEAVLDRVNAELAAELVTSVRCHPDGAHERVNVWLRGAHVGSLLVGEGEGAGLRRLLRSERIVAKARVLVQHWHDQDGFNSSVIDDLMSAVEEVDRDARVPEVQS